MMYKVRYTTQARMDLFAAYEYIARDSPANAARWYDDLEEAIEGLADFPKRCPVARESRAAGAELRQLSRGGYRVMFRISGESVVIVHVRHAGRLDADPGELGP